MHRPTFYPAVGGSSQGGNLASFPSSKVSSRDLPTQGALKRRRKVEPASDLPKSLVSNIDSAPSLASLVKFDDVEQFEDMDRDAGLGGDASSGDESAEVKSAKSEPESGSDDEEEELRRELDAIRKEREAANVMQVKSESQSQLERLQESLAETKLERHWTEDTIFRVPVSDKKGEKPRFINDSVRSDFHKRFLKRYIH